MRRIAGRRTDRGFVLIRVFLGAGFSDGRETIHEKTRNVTKVDS